MKKFTFVALMCLVALGTMGNSCGGSGGSGSIDGDTPSRGGGISDAYPRVGSMVMVGYYDLNNDGLPERHWIIHNMKSNVGPNKNDVYTGWKMDVRIEFGVWFVYYAEYSNYNGVRKPTLRSVVGSPSLTWVNVGPFEVIDNPNTP